MRVPKSVLVVAAHPDDEVLGCGGVIAKLSDQGCLCHVVILAEGVTSRDLHRDIQKNKSKLEALKKQSKQAAQLLGACSVELFDFPDNKMDSLPLLDVVKVVEATIQTHRPEIVFTHFSDDLNIDHTITARAVTTATRPVSGSCVKEVYAFEVLSSTEWNFIHNKAFFPNVFYNIDGYMEKKLQAMACYSTEKRLFPHPRSDDALIALAKSRGSQTGFEMAEAFCLIRRAIV